MNDVLSQTFSALSDPTRRAILDRLAKGEANVQDLAKPFMSAMSLPAITKHLKVLESAGLITRSRDAQYRPCQLNGEPFKKAMSWIDEYRQFWEESFDRLDDYLKTVSVATTKSRSKPKRKKMLKAKNTTESKPKGSPHGRSRKK